MGKKTLRSKNTPPGDYSYTHWLGNHAKETAESVVEPADANPDVLPSDDRTISTGAEVVRRLLDDVKFRMRVLSPTEEMVLMFIHVDGMSQREAGYRFNKSPSQITNAINSIRKKVSHLIAKAEIS